MNCWHPRTKVEQPADATVRYIPLTQGQHAIIDAKNFAKVSQFKYCAVWSNQTKSYYAVRSVSCGGRKQRLCGLHRDIMGLDINDPRTVDHALHDTLDNREFVDGKMNLRIANRAEQMRNRRTPSSNTSGYKGVRRRGNIWEAAIKVHGRTVYLGTRSTAEAAWRELYVPAVIKFHGEFANIDTQRKEVDNERRDAQRDDARSYA